MHSKNDQKTWSLRSLPAPGLLTSSNFLVPSGPRLTSRVRSGVGRFSLINMIPTAQLIAKIPAQMASGFRVESNFRIIRFRHKDATAPPNPAEPPTRPLSSRGRIGQVYADLIGDTSLPVANPLCLKNHWLRAQRILYQQEPVRSKRYAHLGKDRISGTEKA
jgi:hypothetical protein